ncbi:MAG: hypothetical protein V3W28_04760 [Thermoplasmata archaeon]
MTRWALREPALWYVALLLFAILLFALTGSVIRPSGGRGAPEGIVHVVLDHTAGVMILTAYPFLFPLVAILVTLGIVVQRERGGLAAFQARGYRRWEILLAQSLAILSLALLPAFLAFLLFPIFVEPSLALQGNLGALYPARYWTSMPRLLLLIVHTVLFAAAFAMLIRRAAIAFGAMITFFFIGWYLQPRLGLFYVFTPPGAFWVAYGISAPVTESLPIPAGQYYLLHLLVALVAFLIALLYWSRRGELQ